MSLGQTAFTVPGALQNQLVRSFCRCGGDNVCRCGLPRPMSGWTVRSLTDLRKLMREHGSVAIAAQQLGETVHECNRALNALLGRTPAHALAALEAAKART